MLAYCPYSGNANDAHYIMENENKIAIIQPLPGVGDMISFAAHFKKIAEQFPNTEILLYTACTTHAQQYCQYLSVSRVKYFYWHHAPRKHYDNKTKKKRGVRDMLMGMFHLYRDLKKEQPSSLIIFHHSWKYALAGWLARIPNRFGYGYKKQKWFLNKKLFLPHHLIKSHKLYLTEKADILLSKLKICQQPLIPKISVAKEITAQLKTKHQLDNQMIFTVGIGASEFHKQWGEENYFLLCQYLITQYQAKIILAGDEQQQYIASYIKQKLPQYSEHFIDMFKENLLHKTTEVLSCCDMYIGNDTGFLHISAAQEKPTIGLFGSPYAQPLHYSPFIFACTPHKTTGLKKSKTDNTYMLAISVDTVIQKLNAVVDSKQLSKSVAS